MSGKPKILVVEDEAILRLHISKILKQNGFQSLNAENGRKALKILNKERVDLIISDIEMPDLDGYDLLNRVSENPQTAGIPFFFLTGKGSSEARIQGLKQGIQDYITKPINSEELILRVKNTLEMVKRRDCIEFGAVEMAGMLKPGKLSNLIQFNSMNGWTGCIVVKWAPDNTGKIWCRDGHLYAAETSGNLTGEDAIKTMLNLDEAFFYCIEKTTFPEKNIETDTIQVLLTASVSRDQHFQNKKDVLVVRFQALCRKMSEFYSDGEIDHIDGDALKSIEKEVSAIDFSSVTSLDDLERIAESMDSIEEKIRALHFQSSNAMLSIYSREEDFKIEKHLLAQYMSNISISETQRELILERIHAFHEKSPSEDRKKLETKLFTAFRSVTQASQLDMNIEFLGQCQPAIADFIKQKQNWRIVRHTELQAFFRKFSAYSDWSFRIAFTGLMSNLAPFLKNIGRVPLRLSKAMGTTSEPVFLVQRIPIERSNFLYLIAYPLLDSRQEISLLADIGDTWGIFIRNIDTEKLFNRELLLRFLSKFPDNRLFLVRDSSGETPHGDVLFRLLQEWEKRHTVTINSTGRHAVINIIKYLSGMGAG